MRDRDLTAGIILLGVSCFGLIYAGQIPNDEVGLSPGFFPTFLFSGLLLCGGILLWQGWQRTEKVPIPSCKYKRIFSMLVLLFAYILLIQVIYFRAATFLFIIFTMYFLGMRRPVLLVLVSASTTFIIYWLFVYVFKTSLA
ncbi:MAG: tripartite tricarboxylate transporter TctB family protein [Peptococcaceae bacterium]